MHQSIPAGTRNHVQPAVRHGAVVAAERGGKGARAFFVLEGGTSSNCTVTVDGIRFITIPDPTVGIADLGATFGVKWPAAATGECFETLAPGSWQIVPTDAGMNFADGPATLSVS